MSRRPTIMSIPAVLLMVAMLLTAIPAGAQLETETDVLYEVITDVSNEPMSMEITDDGRIIWVQRDGVMWVMTPDGTQSLAGKISTSANASISPDPASLTQPPNRLGAGGLEEGGVQGILLHRDFAENNTVFVYYSAPNTRAEVGDRFEGDFRLSTFTLDPTTNLLDLGSEEVLLTVPAEWDYCCHYAGDLDYLPDGTIVLTTGDDARAEASSGYGPRDHRAFWDNAERTSANPADLRGKILRFTEDGQAPDGETVINPETGEPYAANPFVGMEGWNPHISDALNTYGVDYPDDYDADGDGWIAFDPYVYSLGWKQPWRAVVHPATGQMYVSDVGPDSGPGAEDTRGPAGLEEVNVVPAGGGSHHGWPRCVGPNTPYIDVNWATGEAGDPLDCTADALIARPIGSTDAEDVVTGMTGAPFYYANTASEQWPVVGTGAKTSEPLAIYPAGHEGDLALPDRYGNRLLVLEWSRKFILSIGVDPDTGELNLDNDDMWVVAPTASTNYNPQNPTGVSSPLTVMQSPIDGKVGPDGAFYFVEYGTTFYAGATGRLARIRHADATPTAGHNYGLPVGTADQMGAMDSGLAGVLPIAPQTVLILGLGLALGAIVFRRRTSLT